MSVMYKPKSDQSRCFSAHNNPQGRCEFIMSIMYKPKSDQSRCFSAHYNPQGRCEIHVCCNIVIEETFSNAGLMPLAILQKKAAMFAGR